MDKSMKRILLAMWIVTALAAVALGGAVWMMHTSASRLNIGASADPNSGDPRSGDSAMPVLFDAPGFSDLKDQDGKPFDVVELPMPKPVEHDGHRSTASNSAARSGSPTSSLPIAPASAR